MPLWQAHQSCDVSALNCTVQSRCVQTALNARTSPSAVRTTMPGLLPNLKIRRAVRLERRRLARARARRRRLAARRRNQEPRDGIGDRDRRRHEADRQQRIEEAPPVELGRGQGRDEILVRHAPYQWYVSRTYPTVAW